MAENIIPLENGDTVITNPDRQNIMLNLQDLYKYRMVDDSSAVIRGNGGIVPKEDDLVYDFSSGMFRVAAVDYTNYVADLTHWEAPRSQSDIGVEDVLLGIGPGYSSEAWRCYIDTRVFPHRLRVNSSIHIYGSAAAEIRIFRGVDISESGQVISAYYTDGGDYVSDAIPLEVVETAESNNVANKTPVLGYTTRALNNGEVVTMVAYDQFGQQISIAKLLVHRTNLVRSPSQGLKRIQGIELISPYLSSTEPNVLEVPINVTVSTLTLRGKVTYTDGSSKVLDVGDELSNGPFKLLGLAYWSPSINGRPQDLTLTYQPDPATEYSVLQGETYNGAVTESYVIRPISADPAFSLKLYAFPVWISSVVGYGLEYWLYDLTRDVARRVPKAAVELSSDSPSFDGLEYTAIQNLSVGVNLALVDAEYGEHRHVQMMQIALLRDGTVAGSNWKVRFSGNQPLWYGDGLHARISVAGGGLSKVNLRNGFPDKASWLENIYYRTEPLYDPQTEVKAPEPTHVVLTTKTRTFEVPISQWSNDITIINDLAEGQVLYLRWIRRMANGDLQLGVSGLIVHFS